MKFYKNPTKLEHKASFYLLWIFGVFMTINVLIETIKTITENIFTAIGVLIGGGILVYLFIYIPLSVLRQHKIK